MSEGFRATTWRHFTFYQWIPGSYWYSFDQPSKDERQLILEPLSSFEPRLLNGKSNTLAKLLLLMKLINGINYCYWIENLCSKNFISYELFHGTLMHVNVFSCYKNMNLFHCGDIHEYLRYPFECSMLSQGTPIFTIFLKEYINRIKSK